MRLFSQSFKILLLFGMLVFVQFTTAHAVNPDEVLQDARLEKRARDLSGIIRCMKCQNQSIDDSDAELAKDLRILVRERLTEGDSDDEVLEYLVDRYGEFVLLKPSFSLSNSALWFAPILALFAGLFLSWRTVSKRQSTANPQSAALSQSEHDKITKILDERD